MDAYSYMKLRKIMQDSWSAFFNFDKHFFHPDHVARQATEAGRKLQNSHYDGEKKGWDQEKYVMLQKDSTL